MTLEEIINIDWAELTDLTDYVKYFEDQQILREQLTHFTYQYLRTKLISWEELKEEGLDGINLFSFSYISVNSDKNVTYVVYPVCKRLSISTSFYYNVRFGASGFTFEPSPLLDLKTKNKDIDSIIARTEQLYSKSLLPKQYIEALTLSELLSRCNRYDTNTDEILEKISLNPYMKIIKEESPHKHNYIQFTDTGMFTSKDIIRLNLQREFYEQLKNIKLDTLGSISPDALYYMNEIGQPIFVTLESKFNKNYISTEVNIKNNIVKFSFQGYRYHLNREDNMLVYQSENPNIYIDFSEDKIIEI